MKVKSVKVKNVCEYKKPRVYFFHDESILENLENRRSRPYNEYRKLMPEVLKKANKNPDFADIPENTKAAWSQKAGCSCGCSPGFILQTDNVCLEGVEIFVELK